MHTTVLIGRRRRVNNYGVIKLLVSAITENPTHACGIHQLKNPFALRFPRFKRWREEKAPNKATRTSEIVQMYQGVK